MSWFWTTGSWFLMVGLALDIALSGFFFYLLCVGKFLNDVGRRRDKSAGGGVMGNVIVAITALGGFLWDGVRRSFAAHAL
jgi:hypothetical protein